MEIAERDAANAVIHLYRGELGRMTLYRVRLDTTTNWAVGTSAAIVSFGLGSQQAPHVVFGLAALLNFVFLTMEIRRFRYYEMIRQRVRILENGFYGDVLGGAGEAWEARMLATLKNPETPISFLQAASVRLRRNYIWLMLAIYLGWIVKLSLVGEGLVEAARMGGLSGSLVLGLSAALFVPLAAVALMYRPREEG